MKGPLFLCLILLFWTFASAANTFSGCHENTHITNLKGSITLFGYEDNSRCAWTLTAPKDKVVILTVTSLMTECGWDHLHIFDGPTDSSPPQASLCGTRDNVYATDVFFSSSQYMHLVFSSDLAVSGEGFDLAFQMASCPENCTVSTGNGTACLPSSCSCTRNSKNEIRCLRSDPAEMPPRAGHSAVYDPISDKLFAFGGRSPDLSLNNDLSIYSFATETWEHFNATSDSPLGSSRHAAAMLKGKLYVYGGQTQSGVSDKLHRYDPGVGWVQLTTALRPPPLYGHTLTATSDALFLFGGYSDEIGYSGRLYMYTPATNTWTKLSTAGLDPPRSFGHAAAFHGETASIFFHGGIRHSGRNTYTGRDTLVFNLNTYRWTNAGQNNLIRLHHSAVVKDEFIIFHGGFLPFTNESPETECFHGSVVVYNIFCDQWTTLERKSSLGPAVIRMGHSLFIRDNALYAVGGFNGKYFGGISLVPVDLPASDLSCLPQFCYGLSRCLDCNSRPSCAWCGTTCSVSTDMILRHELSFPTCPNVQTRCTGNTEKGCFLARSCSECSTDSSCSWCEGFKSCLPQNITSNLPCATGWASGHCPGDICDLKSSCDTCTQPSGTPAASCQWCPATMSCTSPEGICSSPLIPSSSSCPVPCGRITSRSMCHSAHSCMWCESQSTCLSEDSYLSHFSFGECVAWSLYDTLQILEVVEATLAPSDYVEYIFDVGDNVLSDIFVMVESSPTLDIAVQALSSQMTWRSTSVLVIRAYDYHRATGRYKIHLTNQHSESVIFKVHVELRASTGGNPTDSFNVVYFVSFFFLFLFSFLFIAIIVKKVRSVILYNRMREEYLQARASRVIPPLFPVQLLTEEKSLRVLTPTIPAVPVAIEYIDTDELKIVAVTFMHVGPIEDGADLADAIPARMSFASTLCKMDPSLRFSVKSSAPAATTNSHHENGSATGEANEADVPAGPRFRMPLRSPWSYRRLENTASSNDVSLQPIPRNESQDSDIF